MIKKYVFLFIIIFSPYLLAQSLVDAGGSDIKFLKESLLKMKLPNNREIKITGHPDYNPIIWRDQNDKLNGVAVDLINQALSEINIKAQFIAVNTWGRAQEEVKNGRIDMLLPPYKNDERIKYMNFYEHPILMDETVVFVKKGKEFKFEQLSDLKNKVGVAIINDSFGAEFDEYDKVHLKMTRLSKTDQCFKFLQKDRGDYLVAGLNSGLTVLSQLSMTEEFSILPKRIIVTGMYSAISLKSSWNIAELQKYIYLKFKEYEAQSKIKKF